MKRYIGTKTLQAQPMTRLEYVQYRGWELPADEDGNDEGFMVEYLDGGESNHPNHTGYISWSPAGVFTQSYQDVTQSMTFGHAIELLKLGCKVARKGWNGKGMFLFLVNGSTFVVNRAPLLGIYPEGTQITYRPHIDIRQADGSVGTWAPSMGDTLAEDWVIVE